MSLKSTSSQIVYLLVTMILFGALSADVVALETQKPSVRSLVNYANSPFDWNVGSLPKNFLATDPIALIQAFLKAPEPKKKEFETSEEFDDRLQKWRETAILGKVLPESRIAIVLPIARVSAEDITFRYDADEGELHLNLAPQSCFGGNQLLLREESRRTGSYIGQNSFGVRREIQRLQVTRFCVDGISRNEIAFSIERASALREKSSAMLVIVARSKSPYAQRVEQLGTPTIDAPLEVHWTEYSLNIQVEQLWVASGLSGSILYRPEKLPGGPDLSSKSRARGDTDDESQDADIDANRNNALHQAIWYGQTARALRIVDRRAVDLNAQNRFGATPLHLAVAKANEKVVAALLNAGARTDIVDNDGATPEGDAKKSGRRNIIELFEHTLAK
jgi:hypothetical protein